MRILERPNSSQKAQFSFSDEKNYRGSASLYFEQSLKISSETNNPNKFYLPQSFEILRFSTKIIMRKSDMEYNHSI